VVRRFGGGEGGGGGVGEGLGRWGVSDGVVNEGGGDREKKGVEQREGGHREGGREAGRKGGRGQKRDRGEG